MERTSGVLLHISSLPNKYGIGSFDQTAYDFVDFLVETGQKYWQILPLTTTSYGDSPYQSFSAFAGNPHFIDLERLVKEGYIKESAVEEADFGDNPLKVNYEKIFKNRRPLLTEAVSKFVEEEGLKTEEYQHFITENESWLMPFAQYMTVKEGQGLKPWYEWPEKFRKYDQKIVQGYCTENKDELNYHLVTQYWFFKQWQSLKTYANKHNIFIIGDMPIYVARDSVEMWTTPELFLVDKKGKPTAVAGVPPDAFSAVGQYWGNPLYDWEYMSQTDYEWWVQRMRESFKLYDAVRIDHFRGFESYWEIPFGAETAATGEWKLGPGVRLFHKITKELGELKIIAEDLGYITDEVIAMREDTGFPGMKILQNGFSGADSLDLPHHYEKNTIAYVGTHDNPTALDWYLNYANAEQRDQADLYLKRCAGEHISDALNREIATSQSKIAIYVMQDLLHLSQEGRMNIPSTIGDNWDWRMTTEAITIDVKEKLLQWTQTYFRLNEAFNQKQPPTLKLERINEGKEEIDEKE